MSLLPRISFRQLLIVAFLGVAALLAAASLNGLITIERLLSRSREGADRAIAATAAVQRLTERSTAMERAARQYLVLDDPSLRDAFGQATRDGVAALDELQRNGLPLERARAWQDVADRVAHQLDMPRNVARLATRSLGDAFRDLAAINAQVAEQVQTAARARNETLRRDLEEGRLALARQVLGAIGIALLMALVFSVWLSRPLRRVVLAIDGLGANRLDQPIDIAGPADVRQLGRSLDDLRARLAKLDSDKARFLRHVSHELKTPLAALREGVSLLEDGVAGELNANQREVARILRQNTQLLQSQIQDLLDFNAAVFEAQNLARKRVELRALLQRVVDDQRLQVQARQLDVRIDGGPAWTEADPDKLATAIGNLLSNAIRFSPVGGTIKCSVSEHGREHWIEIADSGPGVADADRNRVFEPFYRGERQPKNAARGSGIGLSIVHEYIAAHGGRISLLGDGPGATFRIELPHSDVH